jgi:NDP-sugar pyrophosphorylase family protein|tara:strand:- start:112 stop:1773 length:1662 start_codon:yes stop_codon:yes gene_type:complete
MITNMEKNIQKDNTRVLILTGSSIPSEMEKIIGELPSGLIPINGVPVIFRTINNLISKNYSKISIAVDYKKEKIMKMLNKKYNEQVNFEFIDVDQKLAAGNSIITSIKKIKEKHLLVILGFTVIEKNILQSKNFKKDFILSTSNFSKSNKWCVVKVKEKKIEAIYEKEKGIEAGSDFQALIGVYFFKNTNTLKKISKKKDNKIKIEINELLTEYNKIKPISVIKTKNWSEANRNNNYFKSKKNLFPSRFFNFINLDEKNGIVTKKSADKNKLKSEISWYKLIPQKIKLKTPKIISINQKEPSITMEYVQLPTLSEIWLYSEINLKNGIKILKEIEKIINEFKIEKHNVSKNDYFQIYIKKTDKRINELLSKNSKFKKIFNQEEVIINDQIYKNWKNIRKEIFVLSESLFNKNDNCLIHGDLCFSNILYNLKNNQHKLIDPRGKWGTSIFGDIKYDVAKIRHSLIGGYDSINNGLFSIKYEKNKINFEIYKPDTYEEISKKMDLWISKNWNLNDVKLIEGLLFISMLPLHQNDFKKQLAFYSVGIQRLNEVLFT